MTMTEDEIMARAIHAEKQRMRVNGAGEPYITAYVAGDNPGAIAAAIALRNIVIPISEILPEDPDEREAWEIFREVRRGSGVRYEERSAYQSYAMALAAIKRGRALAGEGK